jgi:hypothetical protein
LDGARTGRPGGSLNAELLKAELLKDELLAIPRTGEEINA